MGTCPVHVIGDALRVVRRVPARIDTAVQGVAARWQPANPAGGAAGAAEHGAAQLQVPEGAVSQAIADGASGEDLVTRIRGDIGDADWQALGRRVVTAPVPDAAPEGFLGRTRHTLRRVAHDFRTEFGHRPDPSRLDNAAATALRGRVQRNLQSVFAPLCDDMLTELRALRDVPLDELPRAGAAPVRTAYEHSRVGAAMFRSNVGGTGRHVTNLESHLRSEQLIEGAPRMRELDVVVPIGDYGEPMARALTEAARVMDAVALERLTPHTRALDAHYDRLLGDWTFRRDTMPTLIEGNGSFAGVAGVFTHRRVPGLDGDALLAHIDSDHLFDRAAKGPLGLAGPMFFNGIVPTESVVLQAGRLRPSPQYVALERGTRTRRLLGRIWPSQVRATQRGCPVALRPSTADAADGAALATSRRAKPQGTHIAQLGHEYIALARRFYARELERIADAAT